MELTFDKEVLKNINRASKELQALGLTVQSQLTEEQVNKYLQIMRDLSKEYMNIVGIHAVHLLETSSLLLSCLEGASPEEKAQIQKVCASIDQFVALVKQNPQSSK